MTYRPSSPDIHIWAGHLLFCIGAYQDAAKAYSNINNIQKNPKVLLENVSFTKDFMIVEEKENECAECCVVGVFYHPFRVPLEEHRTEELKEINTKQQQHCQVELIKADQSLYHIS